ncbi:MAG: hypothetical protein ACI4DS_08135, partial [Eubacterium sp.]
MYRLNKAISLLLIVVMTVTMMNGISITKVKASTDEYYAYGSEEYVSEGDSVTFTPIIYDYNDNELDVTDEKFTYEWYRYDAENGYGEVLGTGSSYTIDSVTSSDFYNDETYTAYVCEVYVNGSYVCESWNYIYDKDNTYYASGRDEYASEGDSVTFTIVIYDYDYNELDVTDEKFTYEWYRYDAENGYGEVLGTGSSYTIDSVTSSDFYNDETYTAY